MSPRFTIGLLSTAVLGAAACRDVSRFSSKGERFEGSVEILGRAQSDCAFSEETGGFSSGVEGSRHTLWLGERPELLEARQAGRSLPEPADRLDDAIEFECSQGAGVHG